jgi:hypothetical protein
MIFTGDITLIMNTIGGNLLFILVFSLLRECTNGSTNSQNRKSVPPSCRINLIKYILSGFPCNTSTWKKGMLS